LGLVALRHEDDERAQALSDESLSLCRDHGIRAPLSTVLRLQAVLARRRGDRRTAAGHYAESLRLSRETGQVAGIAAGLLGCGYAALDAGDWTRALALIQESLALRREVGDTTGITASLFGLGQALAEAGRLSEAARLFGAAQARRDALPGTSFLPEREDHERWIGVLQAELGEAAFAAAWAEGQAMSVERAIADAAEVPTPGAPPTRAAAPPATSSAVSLTRREQEVARLVARGLSSREIATALSIAERTAENHVEHILSKLGFRTRVQIATWAVEHELVSRPAAGVSGTGE
jgi:DNA-binding CsgD family transcriptional regulator